MNTHLDINQATGDEPNLAATIHDMFQYHQWTDEQIAAGAKIRAALEEATLVIVRNAPPGPDRDVAIRKLREARMDANSAITHGGRY